MNVLCIMANSESTIYDRKQHNIVKTTVCQLKNKNKLNSKDEWIYQSLATNES